MHHETIIYLYSINAGILYYAASGVKQRYVGANLLKLQIYFYLFNDFKKSLSLLLNFVL